MKCNYILETSSNTIKNHSFLSKEYLYFCIHGDLAPIIYIYSITQESIIQQHLFSTISIQLMGSN